MGGAVERVWDGGRAKEIRTLLAVLYVGPVPVSSGGRGHEPFEYVHPRWCLQPSSIAPIVPAKVFMVPSAGR